MCTDSTEHHTIGVMLTSVLVVTDTTNKYTIAEIFVPDSKRYIRHVLDRSTFTCSNYGNGHFSGLPMAR